MRGKQLTSKHLQLLIALQENPMDRLEGLAKRLNLSRTSVATYLKWLSGEIKAPDKRYFRVVPDLNEDALDLQTVDVFFDTPTIDSLKKVEELCDLYPYTKYRSRCYGGSSEVFAQFRIPKGTVSLLNRFLKVSKKNGVFTSYRILPTGNAFSMFTVPKLEYWDNDSFTWDFDWAVWAKKSVKSITTAPLSHTESKLHLLTKNDVSILSVLPRGVRRKQRVIIDELKSEGIEFTSQEFSRRLRILKENFIPRYHVYIDIEAFDLYSNIVITAHSTSSFSDDLGKRLQSHPIPFRSTLKMTGDFIFWYLRLPPSHLSHLLNYLHENVANLRLSMVDYEKTAVYGLWPEAFDETKKGWRTDTDFMLSRI